MYDKSIYTMKKIYIFLAFTLISGTLLAQSKIGGITYGIRAGVNFSKPSLSGSYFDSGNGKLAKDNEKTVTSYSFGGYVDVPFAEKFSLQPGLSISGKGLKVDGFTSAVFLGNTYYATFKDEFNLMYLELPVNVVFNYKGFYVGAGPYLGYAISGKYKSKRTLTGTSDTNDERDLKIGNKSDDDVKPFDYGVNGMAGYKLENGLSLGLNYGLGLADYQNEGKVNNRVFSILVGFSF
jgi:hypothetical protein